MVRLWYRSPRSGELRQRDMAPYFLEVSGPAYSCYVIGYDTWTKELRTFKLDRLERAQMLDEAYKIPPDFDADAYLAQSWGIMRYRSERGGGPIQSCGRGAGARANVASIAGDRRAGRRQLIVHAARQRSKRDAPLAPKLGGRC